MHRGTPSWIWIVVAAIVGALLPGIFLSVDPHPHFPWIVAALLLAPISAAVTVMFWLFISSRFR